MKNIKLLISILIVASLLFNDSCAKEKGMITGDGVRLRDKPNGQILTKLFKNDTVIVLEKTKENETINGVAAPWYKIKTGKNQEGWIFGAYISETNLINDFENIYIGQYRNKHIFIDVPFKKELFKNLNKKEQVDLINEIIDSIIINENSFEYIGNEAKVDEPRNFAIKSDELKIDGTLSSYLDIINTSVNYDILKDKIDLKLNEKLIIKSKDKSIEAIVESFVVSKNVGGMGSGNLNAVLKTDNNILNDNDIIIASKNLSHYSKNYKLNTINISNNEKEKIEKYVVNRKYQIKNSTYLKGSFNDNFYFILFLKNEPKGDEEYKCEIMIGDINYNFNKIFDLNIVPIATCDFDEDNISDIIVKVIYYEGYCNGIIHYNKNTKKWDLIETNYFGL